MKNLVVVAMIGLALGAICASEGNVTLKKNNDNKEKARRVYVDENGVMRHYDTGDEAAYYGTNYTLPFAHAWRQMQQRQLNPVEVMEQDVAHFARLGLNAFRLHLWDVELSDADGNLLKNEHLDALDHLMAILKKRGIDIILTAQTNFGNGYPERNIDTGAFSYDYDKCDIHSDKNAQKAQARYLQQLMEHKNPYTGSTYGQDNAIIGIEINNEPCHSDSKKNVSKYISRMARALRKGGFDGIILYNVSHNFDVTEAYYDVPEVTATTYQWYPDGLVAGRMRKGNFLPVVGSYPIPWGDSISAFKKKARVVYEFDPGDVMYSHLYPAMARTFRDAGFQWATQFAYDPTPIAPYNTEYQTHYLNLLYTPAKALSMAVAAEVMRNVERGNNTIGKLSEQWPKDTVFGDFRLSYNLDLSEYNAGDKWIYTNSTSALPKDLNNLSHIMGHGKSEVVDYSGSGAYFLDRLESDVTGDDIVWRLELLPDVAIVNDPFAKPSPSKEVAKLWWRENPITITLPSLGEEYFATDIFYPNNNLKSANGSVTLKPGVYLLSKSKDAASMILKENNNGNVSGATSRYSLFDYAAREAEKREPSSDTKPIDGDIWIDHTPAKAVLNGDSLTISATYFGKSAPDSILIYPAGISFWKEHNILYRMERLYDNHGNPTWDYVATIPATNIRADNIGDFHYNIVVYGGNGKEKTFPGNVEGNPLDWDFVSESKYRVPVIEKDKEITILAANKDFTDLDISVMPDDWNFNIQFSSRSPKENDAYIIGVCDSVARTILLRQYVDLSGHPATSDKNAVVIKFSPMEGSIRYPEMTLALYGRKGDVVSVPLKVSASGEAVVKLSEFKSAERYVVPTPYPGFMQRVMPPAATARIDNAADIEFVELRISDGSQLFGLPLSLEYIQLKGD